MAALVEAPGFATKKFQYIEEAGGEELMSWVREAFDDMLKRKRDIGGVVPELSRYSHTDGVFEECRGWIDTNGLHKNLEAYLVRPNRKILMTFRISASQDTAWNTKVVEVPVGRMAPSRLVNRLEIMFDAVSSWTRADLTMRRPIVHPVS